MKYFCTMMFSQAPCTVPLKLNVTLTCDTCSHQKNHQLTRHGTHLGREYSPQERKASVHNQMMGAHINYSCSAARKVTTKLQMLYYYQTSTFFFIEYGFMLQIFNVALLYFRIALSLQAPC